MDKLIYLLPVLPCVIMMGVMMLMMRGHHSAPSVSADTAAQITQLRNEIAALRAAQGAEPQPTAGAPVDADAAGTSAR